MAKLAMVFGVLIALVGVCGYIETHFWHALIPVVLGFLLVFLGLLANTENVKRRMLAMHIAQIGFDFEVLEPPELIEHMRVVGRRLTRAAKPRK